MEDGAVKVVSPTEDTPACRAGIKPGDYITNINGELIYGDTLDEIGRQDARHAGDADHADHRPPGPRQAVRRHAWSARSSRSGRSSGRSRTASATSTSTVRRRHRPGHEAAIAGIDKSTGGHPLGYVVDLRDNPGGSARPGDRGQSTPSSTTARSCRSAAARRTISSVIMRSLATWPMACRSSC